MFIRRRCGAAGRGPEAIARHSRAGKEAEGAGGPRGYPCCHLAHQAERADASRRFPRFSASRTAMKRAAFGRRHVAR